MVTNIGDYKVLKTTTTTTSGNSSVGYAQPSGLRIDEGEFHAAQFSPETIAMLKNALGYGDVIVKCGHCGQWGAVKTSCKYCGSPVDPQ